MIRTFTAILAACMLAGVAYSLMSRDFAPRRERLLNAAKRLEQFPRYFDQVRSVLVAQRVPEVHARTAVAQNRGVLKTIYNYVRPFLGDLSSDERQRIEALHDQMYAIAKPLCREQYSLTEFPDKPSGPFRRAVIRFGLEKACQEAPKANEIVRTAKQSVSDATEFVRQRDLISLVPDPLEIIVMPEFRRGVSLAYCDSPGPLETNQPTFYAVSPPPADWTETQVQSHLREYNTRSIAQLTSAQLPTYFVGYLEHVALRRDAEEAWGDDFDLKSYHDKVVSFGSPPPQFVRALVLDQPIPRDVADYDDTFATQECPLLES